ncbi:tRNA-splicing endonuclease subunit Sen15-like isoform X2 [Apostichopus japonicus]
MKEWGFDGRVSVHAAFTVYLDLCEAKTWWNVSVHPCQELQMVYITGKPVKKAHMKTVLPVLAQEEISVERMDTFLKFIKPLSTNEKCEGDGDKSQEEKAHVITLAVVDTDSTIVYYNISNHLQQPKNLDELEEDGSTTQKQKKRKGGQRWHSKKKGKP